MSTPRGPVHTDLLDPLDITQSEGGAAPESAREAAGGAAPARPGGAAGRSPARRALGVLVRAWRQLTSMRTALLLLVLLALAAIPGSLLPQRSLNPLRVDEYIRGHPGLAPWIDRFSGFDVFAAPWFAAVYLLLFVSLGGCLFARVRAHALALVRRPPKAPAHPARLGGTSWSSTAEPAEVVEAGRTALRRRRFRVATTGDTAAAEKGYLRETGNLIFHIALGALLAGIGLGSWFGYQGTILVVTGDGFTNSLVSYDQFSHGRLVDAGGLRPFSLTLRQFQAAYEPNGEPRSFHAKVDYTTGLDTPAKTADIRVNHPLTIGSAKVYLIGHGYAPHFVLRDARNQIVWDAYQPCTPRDANFASTCTVKIGDTGLPQTGNPKTPQQLAFSAVFTPTTVLDPAQGLVSKYPAPTAPGMTITAYVGNLHIDEGVPQNVYALDLRDMRQLAIGGPLGPNKIAQVLAIASPKQRTVTGLPAGYTLEVDALREFATFQVKSDPYKTWVLAAAIAVVGGLVLSLRGRRRRVWLRVLPAPAGGSVTVEVGGLSRTDSDGFAAELAEIAGQVRDATGREPPDADEQGPDADEQGHDEDEED